MTCPLQRITYLEDEPDIREVAVLALTTLGGFTLDVCKNGYEAVERAPGFKPDLLLLDVMMPGIDGTEVLRRLRETTELADAPAIFMTAKVQKHEVENYFAIGASGVIPKPFNPISLADEIREIWDNAQARREA